MDAASKIFPRGSSWTAFVQPLLSGFRARKDQYDDRTDGTEFEWSAEMPIGQPASTALEPRELVVSADARRGGQSDRLASRVTAPTGTNLVSGIEALTRNARFADFTARMRCPHPPTPAEARACAGCWPHCNPATGVRHLHHQHTACSARRFTDSHYAGCTMKSTFSALIALSMN